MKLKTLIKKTLRGNVEKPPFYAVNGFCRCLKCGATFGVTYAVQRRHAGNYPRGPREFLEKFAADDNLLCVECGGNVEIKPRSHRTIEYVGRKRGFVPRLSKKKWQKLKHTRG